MSEAVKIQLTQEAQKIVANLQTLPPKVVDAIAAGMKLGGQFALAKVKQRLIGVGPFPPSAHKLGRRSGSLYSGVRASDPVIEGESVDSTIGTNVTNRGFSYAAIHEFGGTIKIGQRKKIVRFKTKLIKGRAAHLKKNGDAVDEVLDRYELKKFGKGKNLLQFAKAADRTAYERVVDVAAHEIQMPERAPFRTGIGEAMPSYKREVSKQIVAAWNSLKD